MKLILLALMAGSLACNCQSVPERDVDLPMVEQVDTRGLYVPEVSKLASVQIRRLYLSSLNEGRERMACLFGEVYRDATDSLRMTISHIGVLENWDASDRHVNTRMAGDCFGRGYVGRIHTHIVSRPPARSTLSILDIDTFWKNGHEIITAIVWTAYKEESGYQVVKVRYQFKHGLGGNLTIRLVGVPEGG